MALRWNLEDVEDHDDLYVEKRLPAHRGGKIEEQMRTWADLIIDYCGLIIGIPSITEDNWKRVYRRIHVYERITSPGGSIHYTDIDGHASRYVKPAEVKRMIGLTTNGVRKDREEFVDSLFSSVDDKVDYEDDDLKLEERDAWYKALHEEEENNESE